MLGRQRCLHIQMTYLPKPDVTSGLRSRKSRNEARGVYTILRYTLGYEHMTAVRVALIANEIKISIDARWHFKNRYRLLMFSD